MKRSDYVVVAILFLLAIFIWLKETHWVSSSDDTLPILVAIPLFIWLGMPWVFRSEPPPMSSRGIVLSAIFFLVGIALNLTILLSIGWTLFLWTWLYSRTPEESHSTIKKLLVLALMAFPWISLDAQTLGWWFRLSGAWVTAQFFTLAGYAVQQEGTNLTINNLPISVEVACAGLNTLQSMLIAGTFVAFIILGKTDRYWWNLPLLFFLSWLANTVRIIALCIAALAISPEFAVGTFHTWGGWAILLLMFSLCWLIFSLQEPKNTAEHE